MPKTFKCLSVRQPDAWLMVIGEKTIENRSRRVSHRGQLLIHSSANRKGYEQFREAHQDAGLHDSWFAFGAIIGSVDLVDVVEMSQKLEADPYAWGPYCYRLVNPFWFQQPIPCPGKVTLFTLPPGLVPEVNAQLARAPRRLAVLDSLRKAIRPTEVDVLWDRANEFLELNAYSDAAEFLDTLATKTPNDGDVFAIRAHVRRVLGDFRGALMDFDQALRLDNADLEAALEKADFLVEMGFPDKALPCCQLVTTRATKKQAKEAAGAFFLIGKISLLRGNQGAALAEFSQAITLDPDDGDKRAARGFLYHMLGRAKEADQDFAEATRLRLEAASDEGEEGEE